MQQGTGAVCSPESGLQSEVFQAITARVVIVWDHAQQVLPRDPDVTLVVCMMQKRFCVHSNLHAQNLSMMDDMGSHVPATPVRSQIVIPHREYQSSCAAILDTKAHMVSPGFRSASAQLRSNSDTLHCCAGTNTAP